MPMRNCSRPKLPISHERSSEGPREAPAIFSYCRDRIAIALSDLRYSMRCIEMQRSRPPVFKMSTSTFSARELGISRETLYQYLRAAARNQDNWRSRCATETALARLPAIDQP